MNRVQFLFSTQQNISCRRVSSSKSSIFAGTHVTSIYFTGQRYNPMIKKLTFSTLFSLILSTGISQTKIESSANRTKMQWFADAKLGIFIHAGIYSVKGVDESWS